MVVLTNNSTFTLIVFYFYLELVILGVNIYCTCTVVYMCIILLESIQGLLRYTQRRLNLRGYFYKGIIRRVRSILWEDLMYWLHCMWQRCTSDRRFVWGRHYVVIMEIEMGIESWDVEIWHVEVKGVLSEESISPFLSAFACVYWNYCRIELYYYYHVLLASKCLRYIRNRIENRLGSYPDIQSWSKIFLDFGLHYKGLIYFWHTKLNSVSTDQIEMNIMSILVFGILI